jgi:putative colanic acid biosynthesis glycosyltransferase
MKIAVINTVFSSGSTGNMAQNIVKYGMKHGINVSAYYGRGKRYKECNLIKIDYGIEVYYHKFMTLLTGRQGCFSTFATNRLIKKFDKAGITHAILLNIHGYYINESVLFHYFATKGIKVLYITPDEYAGMGKCCYSHECEKYINVCEKCNYIREYPASFLIDSSTMIQKMKKEDYNVCRHIVFAGPEYNLDKFRKSMLLKNKTLRELDWGIDLEVYRYIYDKDVYRRYNIPYGKVLVLTVAKFSAIGKGVKDVFFEIARSTNDSHYHFINVGFDGNDTDVPNNVTAIRYLSDQQELAKIYSICDLYVLASKADTMPLSCITALACETPICCFNTSGLKYLAPQGKIAAYIEPTSLEAMKKYILKTNKKSAEVMQECRKYAEQRYSVTNFCKKVYMYLGDII